MSTVSMLSDKVREGELIVVDELALEQPKTRDLVALLDALETRVPALLWPRTLTGRCCARPGTSRGPRRCPRLC
jgi:ribosomal protein L4